MCPMMQFSAAPWRVLDEENFRIVKQAVKLHVQMGEYIHSLAVRSAQSGEPILRLMEYEFPGQGMELVTDQFMLGDEILAAPVLEKGAVAREVKLPLGNWKDDRGELWQGGKTVSVKAPIDRLPWFTRMIN